MQNVPTDANAWHSLNELTDEQLAGLLLNGQDDALTVLFDRYHRLVFSVAMRIIHDPGEAEDVVQTVFLDFYRAVANFDAQKGILRVWLLQYAYHRFITGSIWIPLRASLRCRGARMLSPK